MKPKTKNLPVIEFSGEEVREFKQMLKSQIKRLLTTACNENITRVPKALDLTSGKSIDYEIVIKGEWRDDENDKEREVFDLKSIKIESVTFWENDRLCTNDFDPNTLINLKDYK